MKYRRAICSVAVAIVCMKSMAQMFTTGSWEQTNVFSAKVSQLYYEFNVGINVAPQRHASDFLYVAFGYGSPTRKNAWRKFMPAQDIPSGLPKSLQQKLAQSDTDHLHAGKVGVGWNHWFNHAIGRYLQVGWGFSADLDTGDNLTEEEKALLSDGNNRRTFIYNTVPVELGLTLNVWKHYNVQAGVTYMWKEIPLLTIGAGYTF